jgi:predicted nucleic acid-binding protein
VTFLIDSNVISELRKTRPHGAVLAWLAATRPEDIWVPAVVLGELQAGAEITRRQDPAKAEDLDRWIDEIEKSWQLVPMDAAIAREWARLMERKSKVLFEDAMIAATARIRGLAVVTRNIKHFANFNVPVLNPFLTDPKIVGADEID